MEFFDINNMSKWARPLLHLCLNWKDTPGNGVWKRGSYFFVCFFHLFDYTYISSFLLLILFHIQTLFEFFILNVIIFTQQSIDCPLYSSIQVSRPPSRVTGRAVPSGP
jgi:hypothetical protein